MAVDKFVSLEQLTFIIHMTQSMFEALDMIVIFIEMPKF